MITSRDEREQVAELNLLAGKRAKASTAYASALKYLAAGAALLPGDWERQHVLFFELELHRAECEFLTGAIGAAEERLSAFSTRRKYGRTSDRRVPAPEVYTTSIRASGPSKCASNISAHLASTGRRIRQTNRLDEYQRIWSRLGARRIEDLIDLPLMSDPECLKRWMS